MIHVARCKDSPDLSCYRKKRQKGLKRFRYRYQGEFLSDAEYEAKIVCDHFTDEANYEIKDGRRQLTQEARKLEFWIYNRKAIREELLRVFRGKCAYCEYEIAIRTDFDIEHFRPKKAVNDSTTGELKEPGYYWLAADWHNLMPSCKYCNQSRKHTVAGREGTLTLGKKNQFPLRDEAMRLSRPDQDLEEEENYRLLINPCVDYPEEHLCYITLNDNNELGQVRPVLHNNIPDDMGETSIVVYALNSKALVDRRHQHADDVIRILQRISDSAGHYHRASRGDEIEFAAVFYRQLEDSIAELRAKLDPGAVFLGLTRQLVLDCDARGAFALLNRYGIDPVDMVEKSIEAMEQPAT